MPCYKFSGFLQELIEKAQCGQCADVDFIMQQLNRQATLSTTRYIDFALGIVSSEKGKQRIEHYLFHGTLIQRNYASLYFNRLGAWETVKQAYEQGLIDEIQAFAR